MEKIFSKVHYLLLLSIGILATGLTLTYTISVSLGHVYYWFPFISDTGAEPPESGIFGFTLNITTVLLVISMYLRYCQMNCVKKVGVIIITGLEQNSCIFGLLSCFGLNMVANFSEIDMGITHLTGAFLCFTTATIYFIIQTKISYHFINHDSGFSVSKTLFCCRFLLCLFMATFYFLTLWYGKLATDEFTGKKLNYWRENDGGFQYRLISTFSEWITTICIALYIMTFTLEFRKIECIGITVRLKTS
ncbi:LOW QUALITY PROTEIN: DNA damage-regulated autophagy modulator protein 1-like [Atheta coriaria]|uniref:LOW QUALITY PROTEIN: DNA damage-regulated autophagy modulator protein 1-like n=1 Tax=Dalotia coriaria TaxID=877792 RepID=UPI0031F3D77B